MSCSKTHTPDPRVPCLACSALSPALNWMPAGILPSDKPGTSVLCRDLDHLARRCFRRCPSLYTPEHSATTPALLLGQLEQILGHWKVWKRDREELCLSAGLQPTGPVGFRDNQLSCFTSEREGQALDSRREMNSITGQWVNLELFLWSQPVHPTMRNLLKNHFGLGWRDFKPISIWDTFHYPRFLQALASLAWNTRMGEEGKTNLEQVGWEGLGHSRCRVLSQGQAAVTLCSTLSPGIENVIFWCIQRDHKMFFCL